MSTEATSPIIPDRGLTASEKEICSAMRDEPSASSVEGVQTRGQKRALEQSVESEQQRSARRPVRGCSAARSAVAGLLLRLCLSSTC